MPGAAGRTPAWLEARVSGEPMTLRLFLTGLAQAAATHREAIEQVMAEQMAEPEETERALTEAPVPAAKPTEDRKQLMKAVFDALGAHTQALADIAHDLEAQLQRWADEGGEPPPALAARFCWGEEEDDYEDDEDEEEGFRFDPDQKFRLADGVDAEMLRRRLDELDAEEERRLREKEAGEGDPPA
jgi:acyl-CoA reductase-like NAD-dependent aldehyde dehydrogenase